MSNYIATVIKTGNSYALRVPKQYVDDAKLELGQKTNLQLPTAIAAQNHDNIQKILKQLNELVAYKNITNPVTWQRQIRQDRPLPGRN